MVIRIGKISLCAFIALIAGMAVCAAVYAGGSPGKWSRPDWLWDAALVGALFYVAIPLAILMLAAIFGLAPSTALSMLLAIGWLTIIFAWRAYKPWVYYGEFPWWMVKRDFLGMLPIPLSFGLTFAICARNILRSNIALERDAPKPTRPTI